MNTKSPTPRVRVELGLDDQAQPSFAELLQAQDAQDLTVRERIFSAFCTLLQDEGALFTRREVSAACGMSSTNFHVPIQELKAAGVIQEVRLGRHQSPQGLPGLHYRRGERWTEIDQLLAQAKASGDEHRAWKRALEARRAGLAQEAEVTSALGAPVKTSPDETSPAETSPAETSPVETSPAETSPVQAEVTPWAPPAGHPVFTPVPPEGAPGVRWAGEQLTMLTMAESAPNPIFAAVTRRLLPGHQTPVAEQLRRLITLHSGALQAAHPGLEIGWNGSELRIQGAGDPAARQAAAAALGRLKTGLQGLLQSSMMQSVLREVDALKAGTRPAPLALESDIEPITRCLGALARAEEALQAPELTPELTPELAPREAAPREAADPAPRAPIFSAPAGVRERLQRVNLSEAVQALSDSGWRLFAHGARPSAQACAAELQSSLQALHGLEVSPEQIAQMNAYCNAQVPMREGELRISRQHTELISLELSRELGPVWCLRQLDDQDVPQLRRAVTLEGWLDLLISEGRRIEALDWRRKASSEKSSAEKSSAEKTGAPALPAPASAAENGAAQSAPAAQAQAAGRTPLTIGSPLQWDQFMTNRVAQALGRQANSEFMHQLRTRAMRETTRQALLAAGKLPFPTFGPRGLEGDPTEFEKLFAPGSRELKQCYSLMGLVLGGAAKAATEQAYLAMGSGDGLGAMQLMNFARVTGRAARECEALDRVQRLLGPAAPAAPAPASPAEPGNAGARHAAALPPENHKGAPEVTEHDQLMWIPGLEGTLVGPGTPMTRHELLWALRKTEDALLSLCFELQERGALPGRETVRDRDTVNLQAHYAKRVRERYGVDLRTPDAKQLQHVTRAVCEMGIGRSDASMKIIELGERRLWSILTPDRHGTQTLTSVYRSWDWAANVLAKFRALGAR